MRKLIVFMAVLALTLLGSVGVANAANALDAADGSPANAVYVDNEGDVGIGTTTPVGRFEISAANPSGVAYTRFSNSASNGYGSGIEFYDAYVSSKGTGLRGQIFTDPQGEGGGFMHFRVADYNGSMATRMVISNGGNVAIGSGGGSPTGGYRLDVVGNILADDIDIVGESVSVKDLLGKVAALETKVAILEATPPDPVLAAKVANIEAALARPGASGISGGSKSAY